ncbi:hypothetical protein KP509_06G051500 [Ceratopteris richardii]|uniref:Pentatricopeptide repeat-containing protein n=1 Tax=Ceratopteris richardii TaxID=49495 RepID=A0A8T2USM7_CERRI|nr:hypothetical protein KP509_1Z328900 [Ceratopteris richardii]KAH7435139.1 hypothetical protein KP509_06G051500 [Ceratopteris richardii]KAH7435140.1 hypothetical protein KP509_06G051500 [Ceratopteris richardii]
MGSIQNAQQGFDTLEYRNDMSCYALISGYLRQGKPHLAFSSYLKMQDDYGIKLSGRTFVALLKACLTLQDFAKGLEIHADIARLGLLETDAFVGSMLVDFYTKCGSVHKARQVFNKVKNRDVVLWNTLMTGYVNHGLGEEAFHCFKQLQLEDIQPNVVTFICTLKACGLIGSSEKCLAIHVEIERRDLYKTNHLLGTTLVDTYSKCGCVVKAQAVFNALPTHNVVSWTALIPGYADQEHGQAALAAFADMQVEGISPNSVTYICLLKACGCQKALEVGQELHCEIARMDPLYNDLKIGNALVDMYAKCGILDVAHELFDELARKDVVSWNIILAGYVEEELFEETFHCFGHMQVVPDNLTFITVLRACANSKSIIRGQLLHAEIDKKGLFQGEPVIGNALVDMYAKC